MPRIATISLFVFFVGSVAANANMTINLPHLTWPTDAPVVTRSAGN
jgi:hypothetical protein